MFRSKEETNLQNSYSCLFLVLSTKNIITMNSPKNIAQGLFVSASSSESGVVSVSLVSIGQEQSEGSL